MDTFAVAFYNPAAGLQLFVYEGCDGVLDAVLTFLEDEKILDDMEGVGTTGDVQTVLDDISEWLWDNMECELCVEKVS
jgi:hypothetical protein